MRETQPLPIKIWHSFITILEAIKFEHTLFALPFALIGMFYAAGGLPPLKTVLWIMLAMVGARSAAMAFNRIADRAIDAKNPRTKNRALVTGALSLTAMIIFLIISSALLVISAYLLNKLCFYLSPVALIVILGYSLSKRFTSLSHLWLGIALGIAPTAAWIAVKGVIELPPMFLSAGVMFWTAGFDIFYSLQDVEVDKNIGLFSIPKRFGVNGALWFARGFHFMALLFFASAGYMFHAGWAYFGGVIVSAGLIVYEHTLVKPNDLSKVNTAFFTVNSFVSVIMLAFVLIDLFLL